MNDRGSRLQQGMYPFGPGSPAPGRWAAPLAGLLWLAIPLVEFVSTSPPPAEVVLVVAGLAAFALLYISRLGRSGGDLRAQLRFLAGMLAVACVLTIGVSPEWGVLFIYAAAAAGLRLPERVNGLAVLAILAVATGALLFGGADGWLILTVGGSVFGVGALFLLFGGLVRSNEALREARAELADHAVAEERLRFSRDLHDLLGHDLSLIALKAELAGKLMPTRTDEAAAEVDEIKRLTRAALAQVREAVAGYRQPTLASELAGARAAMEAAGIDLRVDAPGASLQPEAESVLAWAVREGATNVLRHSDARHAEITVVPGLATASVEIADDGAGASAPGADSGHGLAGLRERAGSVGGTLDAGGRPEGGFRLRVSVPARGDGPS